MFKNEIAEEICGVFIAEWQINLLKTYHMSHILFSYNRKECLEVYQNLFERREILEEMIQSHPLSSLKEGLKELDLLIMILDKIVFEIDGIWMQHAKLMMGSRLCSIFTELEYWPTKLSPDHYGEYPECDRNCIDEVISGKKAIFHRDFFSNDESESFLEYISNLSDIQVIVKKDHHHTSICVVTDSRYADLLNWVFDHKSYFPVDVYHFIVGVIFGYPEDDIEEFIFSLN